MVYDFGLVAALHAVLQALAQDIVPNHACLEARPRLAVVDTADTIVPIAQRVGFAPGCGRNVGLKVFFAIPLTSNRRLATIRTRNWRAKHLNPAFADGLLACPLHVT